MLDYQKWETGNDANWYLDDPILTRYAKRYLPEAVLSYVEHAFVNAGQLAAGPIDRRAVHTDREGAPKLIRYNRKSEEINEVWYNEGYLQTVRDGYGTGVVAYRYAEGAPATVPFFVNSILLYLLCEAETGFTCPVGLTQSVAFILEKFASAELRQQYLPQIASSDPDTLAQGATFLTEIQGGSDVGAAKTVAVKNGDHYLLTGEKWFASNCDAEVSIILARVNDKPGTKGLGLFLMPRTLPDGSKNRVTIRRLKDKLGVRAVASGELILDQAVGYLIGEEEHGFKYMAEALNVSRLGTALAGLAVARRAFLEAAIYTAHREAFGSTINQFPMVQETLADIITEIEAGWAVGGQMINLFDKVHTYGAGSEEDYKLLRILLSLAKYRLSELGVSAAKRALELHGGNGYIEEYVTPRLLRDAVVNPVWEGTANIQSLEILKTLQKGGGEPFVNLLRNTLSSITEPQLAALASALTEETDQLAHMIKHVLGEDPTTQTAVAKKLADFMYDVYAGVHLLEEAQYDIQQSGDARRVLAAEHWIRLMLRPNRVSRILAGREIGDEVFRSLVMFEAVREEVTL